MYIVEQYKFYLKAKLLQIQCLLKKRKEKKKTKNKTNQGNPSLFFRQGEWLLPEDRTLV